MKLINFATGAVPGQSLYEACVGYHDKALNLLGQGHTKGKVVIKF